MGALSRKFGGEVDGHDRAHAEKMRRGYHLHDADEDSGRRRGTASRFGAVSHLVVGVRSDGGAPRSAYGPFADPGYTAFTAASLA